MHAVLLAALIGAALSMPAFADEAGEIEPGDWSLTGESPNSVMFVKPAAAPEASPYLRVLVRFEERTPFDRRGFASMSSVEINDVDCLEMKTRVLQNSRSTEHNMRGEERVEKVPAPEWKAEAEGSFGAAILAAACGGPDDPTRT